MNAHANAGLKVNQVIDPNVPADYVANELVWYGDTDWTSAALVINATGSAYQDLFGSNGPYNPALLVPFPSVEFDTYVGIVETDPDNDPVGNGIPGGAGDIGGGPLSLNLPDISVSWYDTKTDDIGPIRIGMITLSNDTEGWCTIVSGGDTYMAPVMNGVIGPEPTSLALLGLGGLALLRRR